MGCCFKNKIKGKKYDSRKVEGSIKEVKNNYGDNNNEKNNFKNANKINDIRNITGNKEGNNFDNGNNIKDYKEDNINYISAEINIEECNVNKNIRIINTFEECKRINEWYDKEDDYKFVNEKEIKENCKIKINDKEIDFNYFYKFKEEGKYIIEYTFNKNIKNVACMFCDCS